MTLSGPGSVTRSTYSTFMCSFIQSATGCCTRPSIQVMAVANLFLVKGMFAIVEIPRDEFGGSSDYSQPASESVVKDALIWSAPTCRSFVCGDLSQQVCENRPFQTSAARSRCEKKR